MASGNFANERHTDITNHFLGMGVLGGFPLMLTFVAILAYSFRDVGRAIQQRTAGAIDEHAFIWVLGTLLFGFFMNFWSISLFDQSVIFFYLCLAAIQSIVRTRSGFHGHARPRRLTAGRKTGLTAMSKSRPASTCP